MANREELYTLLALYVATLNNDNSYGTPAELLKVDEFSYDAQHDTDEIKDKGDISERIAILTAVEGSISNASMSWTARAIITGETVSSSSGANGTVQTMDTAGGGEGTPYVGIVAVYAVLNSQRAVIGVPKSKFEKPSFSAGQNAFVTHEMNWMSARPGSSGSAHVRPKLYEHVDDLPDFTVAANWDTYFSGVFS